jgi:hypothetical protein
MMNKKWMRIGLSLLALLLVSSAWYLYSRSSDLKSGVYAESSQELSLTQPAFLGAEAATYLEQEAGISIYVNTTGPLNLNTAKSAMVNIENVTSDYVIGSLAPSGFSSDDYPHCFVHIDGWVVVYYLRPTTQNKAWLGKIIDWRDTSPISDTITNNLLYDGLDHIAFNLNKQGDMVNAKYYHFQYPTATKLLFAIKHAAGSSQIETFNIKIPDTFTIQEYSWSCYSTSHVSYTFKIDDTPISSGVGRHYGGPEITGVILIPNVFHTVSISTASTPYGDQHAYVCLILLYH